MLLNKDLCMPIIESFIIILSNYLSAIYIYITSRKLLINNKQRCFLIISNILLPTVIAIFGGNYNLISKLLYISFACISLIIIDKKIYVSLPTSLLSISIAYCLEYISVIITSIVFYLVSYITSDIITTLFSSVLQIILTILISKINRIKQGFSKLENEDNFGIGLLISSYAITFSLLMTQSDIIGSNIGEILLIGIPLALVGLILWIRSIVERYYKRKIADRADQYTQQEIADKDAYIQQLETEVATLAKQLHRDNHLLSSLDRSAQMLVTTDSAQEREKLVDEIHTLYRERNDMITKDQQANKLLPSTGISLIDGALSDMYVKATAHGISFDLIVGEPIHYLVNNIISQTDLQTLLCDHIKDAIIAIDTADITNGKILVTIEKNEGIFEISIRDNGVDFELDTLTKLGIERVTTHADDGGSGIGFMTTFETLAKAKGSLIITEYENRTPFTKAVTFNFDGLHRFIISSYRKEELKEKISRDDIIYL